MPVSIHDGHLTTANTDKTAYDLEQQRLDAKESRMVSSWLRSYEETGLAQR